MDAWNEFADDIVATLTANDLVAAEDANTVVEVILDALERWEGDI